MSVQPGPPDSIAAIAPRPENRMLRIPIFLRQTPADLRQSIVAAAEAGFLGISVPLALGGLPIFQSDTPKLNDLRDCIPQFKKRDVLEEVASHASEHGLDVHVAISPWRPAENLSPDKTMHWFRKQSSWFAAGPKWKGAGRVPAAARGFCPSNADVRRYWGDLLAEAVEGYPLSGVTLDMQEPPFTLKQGRQRCFCPTCATYAAEQFELDLGHLHNNPHRDDLRRQWHRLQIERTQNWISYFCQRIRRSCSGTLVRLKTAAIAEPVVDSDTSASSEAMDARPEQLIRPLLLQGILDGLEFGDLNLDDPALEEILELNLAVWPDDSMLYPSLLVAKASDLCGRLNTMRQLPMMGFEVEWLGPITSAISAELAFNCFAEAAIAPERTPLEGLEVLFDEIARISPESSGIKEFLADLLTFVRSPAGPNPIFALDTVVQNLRGLETRILQGQVDFGDQASVALCRISQAKRLSRLASHGFGY